MGQTPAKPSVKAITNDVAEIRRSIRRDKERIDNDSKQELQRVLVNYSQQVSSLSKKTKKKDVDNAQKLISEVTSELLTDPAREDSLDMASVETNSFIHVTNKTEKLPKQQKLPVNPNNRVNYATLGDIENRFDSIKLDARVAIANNDKNRMHFLGKSIENLATNLELIPVDQFTVLGERKQQLEKRLAKLYNKVNTAKKQLTRDDNIEYLTELHDKQKRDLCMEKLTEIEKAINNINLPDLTKKGGTDKLETTKEELNSYKDRLNTVEEVGPEIQLRKKEVQELIHKSLDNLENSITKMRNDNVVEEKLIQAEESHQRFKAEVSRFSKSRQSEDYTNFRKYLLQLKDYVTKIPEINADVEERKQAYIKDVDKSLQVLENKGRTIEAKAQSNSSEEVVLRPKTTGSKQSLNTSRTVDGLYSYWKELEETLTPDGLNLDELLTIYHMLTELISLIGVKSGQFHNNIKTKQNQVGEDKKDSHSLASSEESDNLVKVTVKISQSPALNSNVITEPNQRIRVNENIKQIEDTERELKTLEGRVQNSTFAQGGEELEDIKSILESRRRTLNRLSVYRNENIRNSSHDLLKVIDRILKLIRERTSRPSLVQEMSQNRKSSSEEVLNDIMAISTRVVDLGEKCKPFSTISEKDYKHIKPTLIDYRNYLNSINVSSYSNNIRKARDDVLGQITTCLDDLEDMVKGGQSSPMDPEERQFRLDLQNLKDKVSRFSGAYKNVLYKKIEQDLYNCMSDVDKKIKNQGQAQDVKTEIGNSLKILEQKSVKDGEYAGSLKKIRVQQSQIINSEPVLAVRESLSSKLVKIREDIEKVKAELNTTPRTKEEYVALDGRLTLSILALDNLTIIKDKESSDKRQRLYDEIQTQLSYISERITLMEQPSRMIVTQESLNLSKDSKKLDVVEELDKIEKQLEIIKTEIFDFVGLESSEKFFELDELLIQNTLKLDSIKFDKGSQWHFKKLKLLKAIQEYSDTLERRVQETEQILQIEKEVKEMIMKIDSFAGYCQDDEYNSLDEQLINLNVKLSKLRVSDKLLTRKDECSKEIRECVKRLNEAARERDRHLTQGTLV